MPVRRVLSFPVLLAYLAAAGVPCRGPEVLRAAPAATHPTSAAWRSTSAAMPSTSAALPSTSAASPDARAIAARGDPAEDVHAHAHGPDAPRAPSAMPGAVASGSEAPTRGSPSGRAVGADSAPGDGLFWVATCPCGCERTRAPVGGGAARLGVAVPPATLSGLPEAPRVAAVVPVVASVDDVFLAEDPVPI